MDMNSNGLYALYLNTDWIKELQDDLFGVNELITFSKNIINEKKIHVIVISFRLNLSVVSK